MRIVFTQEDFRALLRMLAKRWMLPACSILIVLLSGISRCA
ncbi:MAG: hypothetical protein U0R44_02395 [Candidatus Micrarchaeia archaeon]